MKRTNFSWEYVEPLGHKLWCHHQFFRLIVCTLDFLQLLLMLPQLIAVLPCSIIQGCKCCLNPTYATSLSEIIVLLLTATSWAGLVHLSLSYHFQNISKLCTIHVFQLACVSGCFLRLRNQAFAGICSHHFCFLFNMSICWYLLFASNIPCKT